MKYFSLLLLQFLITTQIWGSVELYTIESNNPRPISDLYSILEYYNSKYADQNILFYVHGRKRELIDELVKIPKLEKNYGVKVIMFHWDSYDTLITRPVKNAEIASESLMESFEIIKKFREDHPLLNKKINLLCHSMGNLILKFLVEKNYMNKEYSEREIEDLKLFDTFVSVGADVPMNSHMDWLSSFHLAGANYIMMNNRDTVLLLSYILDLTHKRPMTYRLGLGFDNFPSRKQDVKKRTVKHFNYIDLSEILVGDHGYYLGKNPIMRVIFNKLFNGADLVNHSLKSETDYYLKQDKVEKNIYYVKD